MEVIEIKENEFNDKIKEGKVLVDCYATWCGPCRMLSPIIDELATNREDTHFYKLDVDEAESICKAYGIMSIPALLLFKDGKLITKSVGLKQIDELEEMLNDL